jgi:transcriptional regulator with XRE-family HTH domain
MAAFCHGSGVAEDGSAEIRSGGTEMTTGQQIRNARRSVGWSQRELAAKAHVSLSVVVRAENSPNELLIKIGHGNALFAALNAAGAVLSADDKGSEP